MSISLRKHMAKLVAATIAVFAMAMVGAAALDQPVAVLSSNLNSSVGTVMTADEIRTAEQALNRAHAEAAVKAQAAVAQAQQQMTAEQLAASRKAAERMAYQQLLAAPISARTVAYSSTLVATDVIKNNATALGNYKLSFYDSCALCNGNAHGITASGTTMTEGRTIAVDPSVIPLGSRVYIEGYGMFIAEDTGGAIKGGKIDIAVSSHEQAYAMGIQYANVYLLG